MYGLGSSAAVGTLRDAADPADVSGMETVTDCPVAWPDGVLLDRSRLVTSETACLALMDVDVISRVWDDLLYDGVDHDHGSGGLMLHSGAFGLHLVWPAQHPVAVAYDPSGVLCGFEVDLDPLAEDDFSDLDEDVSGWSAPVSVPLLSGRAVFGDPSGLPQADGTGGLMEIAWPAAGGAVDVTVLYEHGSRRTLRLRWRPR